ncbi:uncharacterized protein Fot_54543 [Forsythia ovata]|uniref:MATH domain-containing protein n=1 Tax=Forsythia ovata TaxID=205694 RepID=A0ABD1P7E1_9LAMI
MALLPHPVDEDGRARRFHTLKPEWGFSKFIQTETLIDPSNGYLVDDTCLFGAEVFVIKNKGTKECLSLLKVTDSFKREFKISRFSRLGEIWYSEEFKAGDHKWKLSMYPKGSGEEKGRSVSIFLHTIDLERHSSCKKIKADFSMRIKNQLIDGAHCKYAGDSGFGAELKEIGMVVGVNWDGRLGVVTMCFGFEELEGGEGIEESIISLLGDARRKFAGNWQARRDLLYVHDELGFMYVTPMLEKMVLLPHPVDEDGRVRRFHSLKPEWGFSTFIQTETLIDPSSGYLVDDTCVFGAEVFVVKNKGTKECLSLLKATDPFKREFKISRFSRLGKIWFSEEFKAGDHKWKLIMYPKGDIEEKERSVSIFLHSVDLERDSSCKKIKANFYIRIKNQLIDGAHRKNGESSRSTNASLFLNGLGTSSSYLLTLSSTTLWASSQSPAPKMQFEGSPLRDAPLSISNAIMDCYIFFAT